MNLTDFKALLESRAPVKRDGRDYRTRCPAHDDAGRRPDLTFREDDGRILIKCWAGCETESIVKVLGLTMKDLFANDGDGRGTQHTGSPSKPKSKMVYASVEAAGFAIAKRLRGRFTAHWTYQNENGTEAFMVLRFDECGGLRGEKSYRPIHRDGTGYVEGDPPGPLPLYGLPGLPARSEERVYICEGEKAADAARSIGLCATTSAHGSKSPDKTDWQPLAGRDVAIFPDNDDAGRRYANMVAAILLRLRPLPKVKIVELPGLPEKGDMVELVQRCHEANQDDAGISRTLKALIAQTPLARVGDKLTTACIDPFIPFPLDALPEPVRSFAAHGAEAIGCDPSFIAVPLLVGLTAAIGNTRRIELKRGWTEPAIMWAAVIADSGTLKSPALELALRAVRKRQHVAMQLHTKAMERYGPELAVYERDLATWKHSNDNDDPPVRPQEPTPEEFWTSDATTEAVVAMLVSNPRGLLVAPDELATWLGGFDRYAQGRGGDVAHWLEMHGGRPLKINRKTGNPRILYVPCAAASVVGGIQPETLHRALGAEHRANGLAARLLLTCPPRRPKRWTEADIDPKDEAYIEAVFDRLYTLDFSTGPDGKSCPVVVPLSPDGKAAWVDFYNEHAQEQAELAGDLAATWSKLEGYAARLALMIHLVRWAIDDPSLTTVREIDAKSIRAGVQLSRWFGNEARRVYAILGESNEQRDQRRLIELIQRQGGSVTVRGLMRSTRMFADAESAVQALDELSKAGDGCWETPPIGPAGGHPVRRFVLTLGVDADTTSDSSMSSGVVSTSTVSTGMDCSDEQEERAAIHEYDGGLSREEADKHAGVR